MPLLIATELRKGMLVDLQGKIASITYWNIWKSDRRSKIQLRFKELLTGRTTEATALSTLRRSAPCPKPSPHLLRNGRLEMHESWLFNNDGRFQLRSLALAQMDE